MKSAPPPPPMHQQVWAFLASPLSPGRHSVPGDIMPYHWMPFGSFSDTCGKAAAILATPVSRAASASPPSSPLPFSLSTLFYFSSNRIIAWQLPFRPEIMPRNREESVNSSAASLWRAGPVERFNGPFFSGGDYARSGNVIRVPNSFLKSRIVSSSM